MTMRLGAIVLGTILVFFDALYFTILLYRVRQTALLCGTHCVLLQLFSETLSHDCKIQLYEKLGSNPCYCRACELWFMLWKQAAAFHLPNLVSWLEADTILQLMSQRSCRFVHIRQAVVVCPDGLVLHTQDVF